MKIYHNPRCRKSREAVKYLENKKIDFEIIEYLKTQITEQTEREHRKLTKMIHNYELERRVAQYERKSIRKKIKKETNVELESELSKLDNEIEEIDNTITLSGENYNYFAMNKNKLVLNELINAKQI